MSDTKETAAVVTVKRCNLCFVLLAITNFSRNHRSKDGLNGKCRKCNYAVSRSWKSAHPEKRHESYRRRRLTYVNRFMKRQYGITLVDYFRMLREQHGLCICCWSPSSTEKDFSLVVDHCHDTGRVRGLICNSCNLAIGHLANSPERADSLAEYLRSNHG